MKINLVSQAVLYIVLALYLLPGQPAKAQGQVWTTYTNGNYVNDLAVEGDFLWAATEGGVVRWDTRDNTYIKYTRNDGLADNKVLTVAIDSEGGKWFGTFDGGVSYYDGAVWTTYNTSNSDLTENWVQAIAIDNNGGKWFGTRNGGVNHFNGTIWTTYTTSNSPLVYNDVNVITVDNDGSKWFGTENGISHFDGATWTNYDTTNSALADNHIQAIAIDNNGGKWFGTRNGGVTYSDGTIWATYHSLNSDLVSNTVYDIDTDTDGSKWFGTPAGAIRFDGTTWTIYDTSNSVFAVAIDSDGRKWFGFGLYGGGVSHFDGTTWTILATTDSLVHNEIHTITFERSGGRWFGTHGGASWLVGSTWINYTLSNSQLKSSTIMAIAIDKDESIWFGTPNGATHFDGAAWTTYDTLSSELADNWVQAIAIDTDGSKWFGFGILSDGGVSHFNGTDWTTYNIDNSDLADNSIQAIAIDTDGSKWFGTFNSGVSHFNGTDWNTYNTDNSGLADNRIQAIAIDTDGSKWFGTGSGVSRFDGETWTNYSKFNSPLGIYSVEAIAIDKNGGKWFGGNGGVTHFDGANWTTYTPLNSGLTDDNVEVIAIDSSGVKWFGTQSGLNRFGSPATTETYVHVVDEDDNPLPRTWVYRNGLPVADADGVAYSTNALGMLLINEINPSDRLVALAPRYKQPTTRIAHGLPGQNFAFSTNVTNIQFDNQGNTTTDQVYNSASNEYLLTTHKNNTLVTFNLVVSIEWDATDEYMAEIKEAIHKASHYLYDLTDGQMAFGQVAIYDNGQYWADADIQISTKNIVRPYAYIGGITSADKSHVIRIGRGWNGYSGDQGPWNQPDGYRTLTHEFGHYALYLYDEYFAYVFDANGKLLREAEANCIGPQNRSPATDATNASVMDWQYTSSELSARGVPGLWSPLCEQTAQWQLNPTSDIYTDPGESAWETLARKYADTSNPPRWQLITPLQRGSVLAGPTELPPTFLSLPEVTVNNTGASGKPRYLTVEAPNGQGYRGVIVALYKQNGQVISQGLTNNEGRLDVYGAAEGDTVRAATFDGGMAGSVIVGPGDSLTLTLAPINGLAIQAAKGIPHLQVRAEPSPDSSQIDLLVSLQNFGPEADPSVIITEPGSETGFAPRLNYSPTNGAWEGQISFTATQHGMGRIRAVGAVGNSVARLQSTYRLQQLVNAAGYDIYSDDGNLRLYLEADSLPAAETYLVVMPPGAVPGPLPAGLVLIGDPYDITASGALPKLEKPALLTLHYDGALVNPALTPEGLSIYRWSPTDQVWLAVPGSLDEEHKAMIAPVTVLGTYALLAPPGPWNASLSDTIFLPIILKP